MALRGMRCPFELPDPIKDDIQWSFGNDTRVKLLERTGGRVSRIGKGLLAGGFAFGIEFLEPGFGEINLAPHFHQIRTGMGVPTCVAPQSRWDTADRFQIYRDVIAGG